MGEKSEPENPTEVTKKEASKQAIRKKGKRKSERTILQVPGHVENEPQLDGLLGAAATGAGRASRSQRLSFNL